MSQKRRRLGLIVGIFLLVGGPILGTGVIIGSAVGETAGIANAQAYAMGTSTDVVLNADKEMGVWTNVPGGPFCTITGAAGTVPITALDPGMVTAVNNYRLGATFTPPASGTYTVSCQSPLSGMYKVAPPLAAGRLALGIVIGILVIVLGVLVGVALLIVQAIRRSRAPRPAPMAYGPTLPATTEPVGLATPEYGLPAPYAPTPQYAPPVTPQYAAPPVPPAAPEVPTPQPLGGTSEN